MRFLEFWITDHTDNSGFTVETKENPEAFGAVNYHHVISIERVRELESQLASEQKRSLRYKELLYSQSEQGKEIERLASELANAKVEIEEAREVIGFYGSVETWQLRTFNETGVRKGWAMRVRDSDVEYIYGPNRHFGGKRARQFLEKWRREK